MTALILQDFNVKLCILVFGDTFSESSLHLTMTWQIFIISFKPSKDGLRMNEFKQAFS